MQPPLDSVLPRKNSSELGRSSESKSIELILKYNTLQQQDV